MQEIIKQLRNQFNYSQDSLARYLGVSRQMYIKYENGEVEPPLKIVRALCGLYKVPYEVLIDGNFSFYKEKKEVFYKKSEEKTLEIASSVPAYESNKKPNTESNYCETIVNMFRKIVYQKQLKVFAELAGIMQQSTELFSQQGNNLIEQKKEIDPLQSIWNLAESKHWSSEGWKWNRDELYDR